MTTNKTTRVATEPFTAGEEIFCGENGGRSLYVVVGAGGGISLSLADDSVEPWVAITKNSDGEVIGEKEIGVIDDDQLSALCKYKAAKTKQIAAFNAPGNGMRIN